MMTDGEMAKTVFIETQSRIQDDIDHFGGALPEPTALVWDGFIAALLEFGHITPAAHLRLTEMLPKIPNNPVLHVFLGR